MSLPEHTDLVLGTAGHIDHGKSSLVLALTGTDPDRLAEEKQRGITIELGFAQLALADGTQLGVVDVPGHERFVRQMIAGSSGIDLALLCIAADDGVMPQTEEHLAVLELLGIRTCVVALTKIDLVDEEWSLFMADEVQGRLANTPYADAPIVPVSSRTGAHRARVQPHGRRAARAAGR
ncbi:GTP-binding protein, partial [Eggerthella sinensis]|uniref:GTP-binding protein n=1 Tax=Eggerthella sinensis TaxID=242230 RepID=UPI0022E71666